MGSGWRLVWLASSCAQAVANQKTATNLGSPGTVAATGRRQRAARKPTQEAAVITVTEQQRDEMVVKVRRPAVKITRRCKVEKTPQDQKIQTAGKTANPEDESH